MMFGVITVASFPADLSQWDQDEDPYYLEVFGEAEPLLDMTHEDWQRMQPILAGA